MTKYTLLNEKLYGERHRELCDLVGSRLMWRDQKITEVIYIDYGNGGRDYTIYYTTTIKNRIYADNSITISFSSLDDMAHYKIMEELRVIIIRDEKLNSIL